MSSLDYGSPNTTRWYTLTIPQLPDSDWCIGHWYTPVISASSISRNYYGFTSPVEPFNNAEVFGWLCDSAAGPNDLALYAVGLGGTTGGATYGGTPYIPSFNSTPVLVVLQRRSGNKELHWCVNGTTNTAARISDTFTGTTIATGTMVIGAYKNFTTVNNVNPLGEFFVYTDRSLTNAQITTLAAGARPSTATVGADPVILLPFRDGYVATEANIGTGGSTYDATASTGTGWATAADFFSLTVPRIITPITAVAMR